MAMPRLLKFFLTLVAIFFIVAVLAIVGAGMMVMRGPSVPDDSTLVLRIGGELVETPPVDVIGQVTGGARAQTIRGYVDTLRRAKSDPRIDSVLIVPTGFESPYWAKVQELRDAILDFRKSGKRISAYLEQGGDREYYLATAAERIYLLPSSGVDLKGVATYDVFLKGTLDKIGASADFEKIGDYKTAPNQLTQTTYTPAHRQMSEWLTRDMYEQLVARHRGRPQETSRRRPGAHRSRSVPCRTGACVPDWSTGSRMKISSTIAARSARTGRSKARRTGGAGEGWRRATRRAWRWCMCPASSTRATAGSIPSTGRSRDRLVSSKRFGPLAQMMMFARSSCASTAPAGRASRPM